MNLLKNLFVMALAITLTCSTSAVLAGILDLDFTSNGTGNAAPFGGGAPYGTAPGYTEFVVEELGPGDPAVSVNPSITANGVTFTINGSINAWPGNAGNPTPDVLRGDYLFFGPADGVLGVTPFPMPWTVSGLEPNKDYVFTFVHGDNAGAARWLQIDSGTSTLTINGALGTHTGNMTVTANGSGTITGTFTGGGGEGNLAAMSINPFLTEGDANGDGLVNSDDFDVISEFLFTSQSPGDNGDLDLSGLVDFKDFRIWKNAPKSGFGSGAEAFASSVPEPTSLLLVVAGLLGASVVRLRRQR